MTYLARIRLDNGSKVEQTVEEHCRSCAHYASAQNVAGLRKAAYLAGLLHDMGKYTLAFLEYIIRAAAGEKVRRGSVNHTFAAVRFAMERWHTAGEPSLRNMVCEIIAVAAGAHHGMFDCIDPDGKDRLLHRLTTEGIGYQEARESFLLRCADLDELDGLFNAAEKEISAVIERIKPVVTSEQELRFCLSLLTRILLSTIIDADRRDAAQFKFGTLGPARQATPAVWQSRLEGLEAKLAQKPAKSPIDQARRAISDQCRLAAQGGNGIYRLSVPTGGGKTLSSLRYALAAAAEHKKERIFFVIPLLSVLEQNAAVIREFIDDDSLILEHHSNIIHENAKEDELDENELLLETWDSPLVITTLVQLLNTLFSGKTSCIRRMHALANSVIVIDEVQSVPRKMLSLFNMAMNFLSSACNCVIVLCSATQPFLEGAPHALHFQQPADLAPLDPAWGEAFRRTEITNIWKKGGYTTEELSAFAIECMDKMGSLLMVCNTKAEARTLYKAIGHCPDAEIYHLSTAMCMEHRKDRLAKINQCLLKKRRVICVSTQLVEAGVDFSFGCVIRVSAGLDNIVQAAGRCNRSGEFGRLCPVYIVNLRQENLSRLKEIQQSQLAAESVLAQFELNPDRFENDLASESCLRAYYRRLYTDMPGFAQDYPLPHLDTSLFTLLSDNRSFQYHSASKGKYVLAQAFKTAGKEFTVFDDNTTDVLVPHGLGKDLITDLNTDAAKYNLIYRKELLEKTKGFPISLYDYEVKLLRDSGGLYELFDGSVSVLQEDFYSDHTGLDRYGTKNQFLEV